MEIILTIIKSIGEGLGGRPGTHKWEVITAILFGRDFQKPFLDPG